MTGTKKSQYPHIDAMNAEQLQEFIAGDITPDEHSYAIKRKRKLSK